MAVGLKTGPIFYVIGTGSLMHAFFSTIAYRLEDNRWGSKFPNLMKGLYSSEISHEKCRLVLEELVIIRQQLANWSPDHVVWDSENLNKQPPWGNNIAKSITNLSNYFVTSDGKQLLDVLEKSLKASIEIQQPLKIQELR